MSYRGSEAQKAYNRAFSRAYYAHLREQEALDPALKEAHRAQKRAYDLIYHAANRVKRQEQQRLKRLADPKQRLTHDATYRLRHAEEIAVRRLAYGLANPEKRRQTVRTYDLTPPEYVILKAERRRARKRGLPDTFTVIEQAFCRQYFHYSCAICKREEGFEWIVSMDHWIPITSTACPGTIATNMIPLGHGLGGCNNSKSDKDPEPWLTKRFGKRKAAVILKRIHAYFALVAAKEQAS
jgi:hypothetical protein